MTRHLEIGWKLYRAHWRQFVVATLVLFSSWVALELAVISTQRLGVMWNVVLHLAFLVLASGWIVGLHRMASVAVSGGSPGLQQLPASLDRGPAFLAASWLYLVAVAAGLLLIAPGIYVAVRYGLYGHVLATRGVGPVAALRDAGAAAVGRWWDLFRFSGVLVLLNLAGAAVLGLGLLVSFPVSLLATASLARSLRDPRSA